MIENVINFFKSIFTKDTDKRDVVKTAEDTYTALTNDVLPSIESMLSADVSKIEHNKELVNKVATFFSIKSKDLESILEYIRNGLFNIVDIEKDVYKIVNEYLSDIVNTRAVSPRDMSIVRIVGDINIITLYVLDLVYLMTLGKASESDFTNKRLKEIEEFLPEFADLFIVYGNKKRTDVILDDISNVSKELVDISDSENNMSLISELIKRTGKTIMVPAVKGFVGNPVYMVRMWLVDREVKKYEILAEKKRLLEFRVLELKNQINGDNDKDLQKQIEYYETKIGKMEYEMVKIKDN